MFPTLHLAPLLAAAAAVLFSIRMVLLVLLHAVPGGVHPVRDAVSDYAASRERRTRRLAAAASWTLAGAWVALGAAVLSGAPRAAEDPAAGAWMLVLGALLALMPFVPTDLPGDRPTVRGRVHLVMAIAWFTIAYSVIGPMSRMLGPTPLADVVGVLGPIAAVCLAALVVSLIVPPLRTRTFGISERLFILVVTLAPLLCAIALAAGWK